jgi:hypothetical protein
MRSLRRRSRPPPADPDVAHDIGAGILDIAAAQPQPELSGCLVWVYENTPCAICRERSVRSLLERERASDGLLLECVWDCSEAIRTLAKSELAQRA